MRTFLDHFANFIQIWKKITLNLEKKWAKKNEKKIKSNGISRSKNIKSKSKLDKISIYFLHIKREIITLRIWWSFQVPLWRFKQFVNFNKFSLVLLVCVRFFFFFIFCCCSVRVYVILFYCLEMRLFVDHSPYFHICLALMKNIMSNHRL